jgi:hypothetical protein
MAAPDTIKSSVKEKPLCKIALGHKLIHPRQNFDDGPPAQTSPIAAFLLAGMYNLSL